MIRLWYSNYLEELVGALLGNVRALREAGASDPFDTTTVIVPNRNIATYLKFEIARRTGILANFQFEYLYRFFRDSIADENIQILGRDDLHTLILDVLQDDAFLRGGEVESVRTYLDAATHEDARHRRLWQLASELAKVFEEYTLSRPRMLELWPRGPVINDEPFTSTERWQRRIWIELFGKDGRVQRASRKHGRRLLLMPELFDNPNALVDLPDHVHVFGLSYVARSFYKLFGKLAERSHVLVYTLNPCMEYWEDVPSGWNIGHAKSWGRRDAEQSVLQFAREDESIADDSPPALRAWGRPGRDNIHMLNMLTDCDFAGVFVNPSAEGDTLLHRLQRDILVRQPVSAHPDRHYEDDTMKVLACPNVQREVEVVANEILDLKRRYAERGETLEFHDIAVIVNDAERDAYQARIRSVFRATHQIPHNIIDITASAHRRYIEAVDLLIALPFGRFTRRELLRLLTHDNVIAGCEGVDPRTWERWCEELNVLHGADAADHEGTYIDKSLYHWDQGLKRLVLGSFMTGEVAGDERIAKIGDDEYLPLELSGQEVASAAQFVRLARSLIADARWLARDRRSLAQWMNIVADLTARYLAPVDDDDEYDRLRVVRFLRELAERDLSTTPVPFRVAQEFVKKSLASLEISRGQYLSEGVVISSFLPMRPIPFKVVFVTGLGERFFPRSDVRSPLDLRWAPELEPVRGDVVSARAQDEYMFLETLISTRDRFYMSYVSRDGHTGEELEPSSVVRLLWFMLEQNYVTPENLEKRWVKHPLRRWDDAYFGPEQQLANYQPDAHREATTVQTRRSMEEFCEAENVPFPDRGALWRDLDEPRRDELATRLGIVEPPADDAFAAKEDETTDVDLRQLRKFLESPTQGTAQFHLGMREDDFEDPYGVEDEVFESDVLQRALLLRQAFVDALLHGSEVNEQALRERYDEQFERAQLRGLVPSGPFGAADRQKHLAVLNQWLKNFRALGLQGPPTVVQFGRSRGATLVATERHDAIDLLVPDADARLLGRTELWWPDEACSLVLTASSGRARDGSAERPFLRGFIDQAVLAAAGLAPNREWTVVLNVARDLDFEKHRRVFAPFDEKTATTWLSTIVESMLARHDTWFLPIEAVFSHRYAKKKKTIERWLEETADSYTWCSFWTGPLHKPQERFEIPPQPDAVIEHRFGAYFSRRQ